MKSQNQRSSSVPAEKSEDLLRALARNKVTWQEIRVAILLFAGKTEPKIARELVLTTSTIKTYVKRIYSKLDVHNRIEFVKAMDGNGS